MKSTFGKVIVSIVGVLTFVLFFQNCGKLSTAEDSAKDSSSIGLAPENETPAPVAASQSNSNVPVFTLHASGGATFGGHIIPLNQDGSWLNTYDRVGLGSQQDVIDNNVVAMGARWARASSMLQALQLELSVADQTHVRVFTVPVVATPAVSYNPLDISQAIAAKHQAGNIGKFLTYNGTATGINMANAKFSYIGNNLSSIGLGLPDFMEAYPSASGFDPRFDPEASSIYKIGESTAANETIVHMAFSVLNILNQNFSLTSQSMSGFYTLGQPNTPSTREQQDARHQQFASYVGKAIKLALAKKKPLFVVLNTAGTMAAPQGSSAGATYTSPHQSSMIVFFVVDPKNLISAPNLVENYQIGGYSGGNPANVDDNYAMSISSLPSLGASNENSAKIAASIVLANYLNVNGMADQIGQATDGFVEANNSAIIRTSAVVEKK